MATLLEQKSQIDKLWEENLGIKRKCVFQVKRITERNEFNLGRIVCVNGFL